MVKASISTLKAKLSEFLRRVKEGEEVVVTERGRPIARLLPLEGVPEMDARLTDLVRSGRARPPRAPLPEDFFERPVGADPEGLVLEALLEERAEGR